MSEPDNVVNIDRGEQQTFEGLAVSTITDTLKSAKSQPATRTRHHFEHVEGWFEGRVIAINNPGVGEGQVERIQVIEVLKWGAK